MDFVIMCEVIEGFYLDCNMYEGWGEMMFFKDMVIFVCKIIVYCLECIVCCLFELVMKCMKYVIVIYKVNSFYMIDGLFLCEVCKVV